MEASCIRTWTSTNIECKKRRNQEGDIAQLGERTTEVHQESNRAVPGSIPGGATLFAYGAYLHLPTS